MTKTVTSCDWVTSTVTEQALNEYVQVGVLSAKEVIHWQALGAKTRPEPKEGEVIVFADHMGRGFSPPGSQFFRDVLNFYQLYLQGIGPNSVCIICNFHVFHVVYI